MKTTIQILFLAIVLGALGYVFWWFTTQMQLIPATNQNATTTEPVATTTEPIEEAATTTPPEPSATSSSSTLIRVTSPMAGETVGNPIRLSGEARGYWFFEASAPVVVVDWDGRIIGEGYVTADDEWMTEAFVPFSGSIVYDLPVETLEWNGAVIFRRDNPSGLPENDAAVEIPVTFKKMVACTDEAKAAEFCTQEYAPVCGLVEVQCVTTPCPPVPETFSNGCTACAQGNVTTYTEGACELEA